MLLRQLSTFYPHSINISPLDLFHRGLFFYIATTVLSGKHSGMIDFFIKYLEFEKRASPNTLLAYQNDLGQFQQLVNSFDETNIEKADYSMIRAWIVQLVDSGIEASSVNRKIASLRSFYKFLLRQEIIEKDPTLKIKVLKTKKNLPSFVNESEIPQLLDQPKKQFDHTLEGHRNRLILEMLYGTGMRLSELLNLKEVNVDISGRTIKVLGKRNKERVIPFPSVLVSMIEAYRRERNRMVEKKDHGFFFVTDKGEQCYPMMIYKLVKTYLDDNTSVDKRSPHVLRHTFATHLLNKGAEINAVKDLLGHSSLAATQVYTHNSMEKLKKVFDQAHPKA
jgi:integrase/recombinase XerC